MTFESFIKSRWATAVLTVVLVFMVTVSGRLYLRKYEIDKEIAKLQEQASRIESESNQLSELINYLSTPEYVEKQAREQLNLKKEGEEVVILPDSIEDEAKIAGADTKAESNPKKWYKYLFENNEN